MTPVFYDTWAYLALANAADPGHGVAQELDEYLEDTGAVAVTSDWVLDEAITGLQSAAGASASLVLLDFIETSVGAGDLTLLHVSVTRRQQALALFKRLAKDTPRLSLTDCSSFALMRELSIKHAFTVDPHFNKAGGGIRPLVVREKDRFSHRRI